MIALFMSANFTSCTPTSMSDEKQTEQACCDEDGDIDPPPPTPPPPTDGD